MRARLCLPLFLCIAVACGLMPVAIAQSSPEPPAAVAEPEDDVQPPAADAYVFDTLLVSGRVQGPGLWKVSRGEHVMWVLATVSPLPRDIEWDAAAVEAVIAQSQAWLQSPRTAFAPRGGRIAGLAALPAAMRARRNPDGQSLQEVVPPADYQRWRRLKARYLPRNDNVEQWRPAIAGQTLYSAAIRQAGMTHDDRIHAALTPLARRHRLATIEVREQVRVENVRAKLRQFSEQHFDDLSCLRLTMDRAEHDLPTMARRANAWAHGDTASLIAQGRTMRRSDADACEAVFQQVVGEQIGFEQAVARARQRWLREAEAALARNASTFSTLPLHEVVGENGLLAQLRARGYEVIAP